MKHSGRSARAAALALSLMAALSNACWTQESATRTARCRAQTTSQTCEACCTGGRDQDRTNTYKFNAPGDCRCVLRYWLYLQ